MPLVPGGWGPGQRTRHSPFSPHEALDERALTLSVPGTGVHSCFIDKASSEGWGGGHSQLCPRLPPPSQAPQGVSPHALARSLGDPGCGYDLAHAGDPWQTRWGFGKGTYARLAEGVIPIRALPLTAFSPAGSNTESCAPWKRSPSPPYSPHDCRRAPGTCLETT